ncbi:MAG: M48 family metallopeptidase [Planctomycetota bacterium]
MDFFDHQDRAKRNSGRLVLLFGLAVLGTIVAVYAAAAVLLGVMSRTNTKGSTGARVVAPSESGVDLWDPGLFALVAVATGGVIGATSLVKTLQLRAGGGSVVAAMLGGRLVPRETTDPGEKVLLNVVDEMAIASGTPAPPVYLMDGEAGINAFAAGYAVDKAVIGVTRGCVDRLTRDQLQGVIAHEFSHILHGDMRINIRLIGLIHGIVALSVIGWVVIRSMLYTPVRRRRSSSGKNEGAGKLAFLAFGVALIVIGSVGRLFGMLIQSAISRQREFLADAAAVQYTRNPDGIAGALAVIGGLKEGARVEDPQAAEVRHMLFANGVVSAMSSAFASHPPLKERIARIHPQMAHEVGAGSSHAAGGSGSSGLAMGFAGEEGDARPGPVAPTTPAVQAVGEVDPEHVAYARELLAQAPGILVRAADSAFGARAVVYALLLDRGDEGSRREQFAALERTADPKVLELTRALEGAALRLPVEARLPVLDLTWSSLAALSPGQAKAFMGSIDALIEADQRLELFEWSLRRLVRRRMAAGGREAPKTFRLTAVGDDLKRVALALAAAGDRRDDPDAASRAYQAAVAEAGLALGAPPEPPSAQQLDTALDRLSRLRPSDARVALRALAKAVSEDGRVTPSEGELLRVAAESLGAPMSPLLPGQPVV